MDWVSPTAVPCRQWMVLVSWDKRQLMHQQWERAPDTEAQGSADGALGQLCRASLLTVLCTGTPPHPHLRSICEVVCVSGKQWNYIPQVIVSSLPVCAVHTRSSQNSLKLRFHNSPRLCRASHVFLTQAPAVQAQILAE